MEMLPRDRPVVAFCRGPYCTPADRAVDLLWASGLKALRCSGGVAEWRSLGLSIVSRPDTRDNGHPIEEN